MLPPGTMWRGSDGRMRKIVSTTPYRRPAQPSYYPTTRQRRRARGRYNKKSGFVAKVHQAMLSAEETKYIRETLLDSSSGTYVNFNSVINTSADWYTMIPQVGAGVNSAQKIGKQITPMNITGHWRFKFAKDDDNTRDIMVVLYVLTSKQQKSYGTTARNGNMLAGYGGFLDPGDGASDSYFKGDWLTSNLLINKDTFTLLHKRMFHLSRSSGSENGSGVVGQYDGTGTGQYAVSPRASVSHTFTLGKTHLKKLLYDQSTNTVCTNFAPWWAVGYYYTDGTPADTGGGLLQVDYTTEMHFKDD